MRLKACTQELRAHRLHTHKKRGPLWRPQTVQERFVDFRGIGKKLDAAKEQFIASLAPACQEMVAGLVEDAAQAVAAKDLNALRGIKPSHGGKINSKVRGQLSSLTAYGRQTIHDERERAMLPIQAKQDRREGDSAYAIPYAAAPATVRRKVSPEYPDTDIDPFEIPDDLMDEDDVAEYQSAKAKATTDMIGAGVQQVMTRQGMGLLRQGVEYGAAIAALTGLAMSALDRLLGTAANNTVNEAFNMGRGLGIGDMLSDEFDSIRAGTYSALNDDAVCEVCEALDGQTFFPDEEEFYTYMDGNPECVGVEYGNSCRCMMFLEYNDMVPPMPGWEGLNPSDEEEYL